MWADVLLCFRRLSGKTPLCSYYPNDGSYILLKCSHCRKHWSLAVVFIALQPLCFWLHTPRVCQAEMTILWRNGLLWIPPLVGLVFKPIFNHFSRPLCFSLLLSTDSSLAQAITARTPLSWHIYITKDRTEPEKPPEGFLNPGSCAYTAPSIFLSVTTIQCVFAWLGSV